MKTCKKLLSVLLVILLMGSFAVSSFAALEVFDEARAKTTAADFVNVPEADMKNYKYSFETQNGIKFHEIEFSYKGVEYEFEINSLTGIIKDFEYSSNKVIPVKSDNLYIGEAAAKEKALTYTAVSADDAIFTSSKIGIENYAAHYEFEFYGKDAEYDVEVDAINGDVAVVDKEQQNAFIMFFIRLFAMIGRLFGLI